LDKPKLYPTKSHVAELTALPDWIHYNTKNDFYYVRLLPLKCNNCDHEWYPKIKCGGVLLIPGTCPVCRTKAWRTIRS